MSTNQAERDVLALAPITESPTAQGVAAKIRNGIARFDQDERGNVAMLFGLLASIMIGFTGLAVDFGRWVNARDMTVAAMDAAVLAGGRAMQTNGGNATNAATVAKAFYDAAVQNRIPSFNDTVNFTVTTTQKGQEIQGVGNAYIKAPFISTAYNMFHSCVGGRMASDVCDGKVANNLWPLLAAGTPSKDASRAIFANGVGGNKSLEIGMMLDVSGSMGGQKLTDMKLAAKDLIDIVIWADQSKYKSRVALVPFSADVRLSQSMRDAVANPGLAPNYTENLSGNPQTYYRSLCVVERGGAEKYSDAKPEANKYITVGYDKNQSNGVGACSTPAESAVVPMSDDKNMLKNKVDGLVLGGGTGGHIGTAWAYYMLSPKWKSILGASSEPSEYSDNKVKKIAILMTDGEYNYVYRPIKECKKSNGDPVKCSDTSKVATITNPPNVGIDDSNDASDSINATSSPEQAKSICDNMKGNGIEVYTVGFALGGNTTATNTLSYCASGTDHFYNTTTGEQLRQAFRDIAVKVTKLVLTN